MQESVSSIESDKDGEEYDDDDDDNDDWLSTIVLTGQ